MEMTPIESKLITHYGYDPVHQVFRVQFKSSGKSGEYFPFTAEDWSAFQAAPSKGSHILKVIKQSKSYRSL